jgi:molybdate transport system substrate-binding protein
MICVMKIMKRFIGFCIIFCAFGFGGCHKTEKTTPTLTLFVATSLTDVIQEIGSAYQKDHEIELIYNFASSGALAQQLLASPRADLYLSASEKWMDAVENGGKLKAGTRRTLLSNHLVVIANAKSDYHPLTPLDIGALSFSFLSIGDPDSVPAGRYAKMWLSSLKTEDGGNLWDKVSGRISPTPDVRSALMQVEGSADVIGIVYETDYKVRPQALRLLYQVPTDEGPRISYSVSILDETKLPELSQDFLEYLGSPSISSVFEKYGFTPLN